ncbi:MAG: bacillithiol system redox-active protein YtxJ [Acidobacteria bacterium]|nr:bacillithiol system redox-active protein YtxJ [Acidobacteriota bacterium]
MAQASKQGGEFEELTEAGALEALIERSREAPVVLFKHSLTCPISAFAYGEMSRLALDVAEATVLVVIQRARAVSNEIAARTGVRHESPQAIILRNGTAVWTASHYRPLGRVGRRARMSLRRGSIEARLPVRALRQRDDRRAGVAARKCRG